MAEKFTGGNASFPFHDKHGKLERFVEGLSRRPTSSALRQDHLEPVLAAPFRFYCRYLEDKTVEIGDHVVLFGQVTGFHETRRDADESTSCLIHLNGQYRGAHQVISYHSS